MRIFQGTFVALFNARLYELIFNESTFMIHAIFYEEYECVMISEKLSSEHVVVVWKKVKSIGKSKKYWKTTPYMVKLFS